MDSTWQQVQWLDPLSEKKKKKEFFCIIHCIKLAFKNYDYRFLALGRKLKIDSERWRKVATILDELISYLSGPTF